MPKEIYLVLDNIRSILNVGAIFRTADAAGVKKVYLCGITAYPSEKEIEDPAYTAPIINDNNITITYEPTYSTVKSSLEKKIAKTALKALGEVNFVYKTSTKEAIKELNSKNIAIVSLEQEQHSIDYCKYNFPDKVAVIVGNEINGVGEYALKNSDAILEIPMQGHVKSLNVATATGIILFKAREN